MPEHRLVVQCPVLHARLAVRTIRLAGEADDVADGPADERRRGGTRWCRADHCRQVAAARQHAVADVRLAGLGALLRTVLRHREAIAGSVFGDPADHRHGLVRRRSQDLVGVDRGHVAALAEPGQRLAAVGEVPVAARIVDAQLPVVPRQRVAAPAGDGNAVFRQLVARQVADAIDGVADRVQRGPAVTWALARYGWPLLKRGGSTCSRAKPMRSTWNVNSWLPKFEKSIPHSRASCSGLLCVKRLSGRTTRRHWPSICSRAPSPTTLTALEAFSSALRLMLSTRLTCRSASSTFVIWRT